MALTNTAHRYGSISKCFHWLTALLILTLIPVGIYASNLPHDTGAELARKAWFFSLHKTLGVAVFFVALARILWAISQAKPGLLNADHRFESFAAETVHWLLYAALVFLPLSGWIAHAAAAGFAPIWWPFGQGLPLVPKSTGIEHFFGALHWLAGRVLILSLLLHIAGALKHHFIDRDATLRRMLPGEPSFGPLPAQHQSHAALITATTIWALAIVSAGFLASTGPKDTAVPVALDKVASDWQVQNGSIDITVDQFGSEVTGHFADWTAAITFDEASDATTLGSVIATINVASLTLGSVTDQALGPDFFDRDSFPTAVFTADIQRAADGYDAIGSLTIKDSSLPVTLPFALTITGDSAKMRGALILDRRDFGIGKNISDEGSLAFAVKVNISLTATREK